MTERAVTEFTCDTCGKTQNDRGLLPDTWWEVTWGGAPHCAGYTQHFCSNQCLDSARKALS